MCPQSNISCPQCSRIFSTTDKRQIYCSKACSGQANSGVNHYRWKGWYINHYGYAFIYAPGHPHANSSGYAREHIVVATELLGRPLRKGECVHHISGDRLDNRPENLQVMTLSEHSHLHNHDAPDWYSDEKLISALHEMKRRLGRNPRKRDVDLFSDLPGRKAFERHFGTWNNALKAAGLPVNMVR